MIQFAVIGKPEPGGSKKAFLPIKKEYMGLTVGAAKKMGRLIPVVVDANAKVGAWKALVAKKAEQQMVLRDPMEGPLKVRFTFYLQRPKAHFSSKGDVKPSFRDADPTTRPDTTKLVRAVEDACTGILWRDDAQIVEQEALKRYCPVGTLPHVIIEVWSRTCDT